MTSLTAERFTHLPQHPTRDPIAQALAELIALLARVCAENDARKARARR